MGINSAKESISVTGGSDITHSPVSFGSPKCVCFCLLASMSGMVCFLMYRPGQANQANQLGCVVDDDDDDWDDDDDGDDDESEWYLGRKSLALSGVWKKSGSEYRAIIMEKEMEKRKREREREGGR